VRETGNPADTAIGANGGATGAIEFVGATNAISSQPQVTRVVTSNQWMTLVFDLPNEPVRNFVGGNGVLSSATGLGTLEHIAFVPAAGAGTYNVYLDNFIVSTPKTLTYSLSNAPAGATVHPITGTFSWTPTETQGPGLYYITVRVTDNNLPPASDTKTFQVTVTESNQPPVIPAIADRVVHAGTLVTFTNSATDADEPANALSFSLDPGAPTLATIGSSDGIFNWQTTAAQVGTTNLITVRATDEGVPPLNAAQSFSVAVLARPTIDNAEVSGNNFILTWSAIPEQRYRVQYKDNLEDPQWNDLLPDIIATQATAEIVDPLGGEQRFYRVQVIAP
jgi:hypothetical protein